MKKTTEMVLLTLLKQDETVTADQMERAVAVLRNETTAYEGLLRQSKVAGLLNVNRATVWRMVKEGCLHPIELRPGLWRYPVQEIMSLVNSRKTTTSQTTKK